MTDEDLLHDRPNPEFGSGVIGVCDVCGRRQAVIVLQRERFQLCVLDFLNKTWSTSGRKPGAPLPPYRSERVWFPTRSSASGKAPAIVLSPTKAVRRPVVLVTPDVYGLTTSILDGAIRLARDGFEVVLPDLGRTSEVGPSTHLALRLGARTGGGVPVEGKKVTSLVELFRDALAYGKTRELTDISKTAVFGCSYGASLATIVAAREPSLSALALAYPIPVRPPAVLGVVSAPTFIVYGSLDPGAGRFVAQVQGASGGQPRGLELLEIPGVRHQFLARDLASYQMEAAERAWGGLTGFLRKQLLPPPIKPPPPPIARSIPPGGPAVAKPAAASPS